VPIDTITAIVFASGVAVSFLFLPIQKAEEALVGNISSISGMEVLVIFLLSLFIFIVIKKITREMMIISVSEDLAKVEGINIKKYNLIFVLSLAIIVALGVKLVGALLTVALVSVPAAIAKNISWSLASFVYFSFFFGIISPIIGISLASFLNMPAGILTIIISSVIFLISVFFQRK
jgi:ABC-type Mn2+/Zn2+ transport system permease subunit